MVFTQVNLNGEINSSLQVGDLAYVSEPIGGNLVGPPVYAGKINAINSSGVVIEGLDNIILDPNQPDSHRQFLSFAKPISVNESSLKGYYADVTFRNTSNTAAELFAISADVVSSSK